MTMIGLPCLAAGFLMSLIAILFVLSALALIFIILLQRGKGGGLTAALGGGMASGLLGAKTGDVLTWVTISLVAVFLFLAVLMAKYYRPTTSQYGTTQRTDTKQTMPAAEADQNAAAPAASTPATVPGPNAPAQ